MKRKTMANYKIGAFLIAFILTLCPLFGFSASADESADTSINDEVIYTEENIGENEKIEEENAPSVDEKEEKGEKQEQSSVYENIFSEIYAEIEINADKIFSVLAFLGTLIVGVGYKRGLLPLLRDALSKLKGSIDLAKEENDKNSLLAESKMDDISQAISEIKVGLTKSNEELERINWQFESYEELLCEREKLKCILKGQMDMLYAIFMSSSLPQYQKDEIGAKIAEMREELSDYEAEKN